MNRELLEHAITIMERVRDTDQPFGMATWFWDWDHPYDCGTAACFAGWCARDPVMQEAGFYADGGAVRSDGYWGAEAVGCLFGLSPDAARYLVYPRSYRPIRRIKPDHVIAHIRALIENDGQRPGEGAAHKPDE